MDWVERGLAIGNIEDAFALERAGFPEVRSILNLNGFPNLQHTPLSWHCVPLIDGAGNTDELIQLAVYLLARLHATHAPVLVQCAEGVSRSVFITSIYLAWRQGNEFAVSYEQVKRYRTAAIVDHELMKMAEPVLARLLSSTAPVVLQAPDGVLAHQKPVAAPEIPIHRLTPG